LKILFIKKQLFLEEKKEFSNDKILEDEADKFASDLLIPAEKNEQIPQQRHIWHINQLTLVKNPLDFLPKLMPLNHLRHFENSFY
jgi:hypothetical protein